MDEEGLEKVEESWFRPAEIFIISLKAATRFVFTCSAAAMRCWQHKRNIFMVLSFTLCFMQIIYVMINSLSQLFRGKLKVIRHLLLCAVLPSNILLFIAPE